MSAVRKPSVLETLSKQTLRTTLQAALERLAPRMDLAPLLRVLHAIGYSAETIVYRSQVTTLHQPNLVHSIEFEALDDRGSSGWAVVTLNIGLLATQSPLPSYVFRYLAAQHGTALAGFLDLCAHHLLRQVVESQVPALAFGPAGLLAAQRHTLTLLGLTTPSTLHWLLSHAFPELHVEVTRSTQRVSLAARQVMFGVTTFGDGSAFGAQSWVRVPSLCIRLWSDTPSCGTGEPWHREVPARLAAWLWPLFRNLSLHVDVELIIREASDVLSLGPSAQLGMQPFPSLTQPLPARRLSIFRGDVRHAASSSLRASGEAQIGSES